MIDGELYDLETDFYMRKNRLAPFIRKYLNVKTFKSLQRAWDHYRQETGISNYKGTLFTVEYDPGIQHTIHNVSFVRKYTNMIRRLRELDAPQFDGRIAIGEIPSYLLLPLLKNPEY